MYDFIIRNSSQFKLELGKDNKKLFYGLRKYVTSDFVLTTDVINEIKSDLKVSERSIRFMYEFLYLSPVRELYEDSNKIIDYNHNYTHNLDDLIDYDITKDKLLKSINKLKPKYASVIHDIYLLPKKMTYKQIGERLDISGSRVEQIKNLAISVLKEDLCQS
jgi:DNA-directed RNA polymerase specialized sigma subunit